MRHTLILAALVATAFVFTAVAAADHGKPKQQPHPNKVTVPIQTTDNGCSGTPWATDSISRTLKVHRNKDGSYRIREEDKGTFTTLAAVSPGNCPENTSRHGTAVRAGVIGTLKGYIKGTVTGGTFNPSATCSVNPCMQAMFIAAFFGPSAVFSCRTNSTDCKFDYKYHAKHDQTLLFRSWRDSGSGAGSLLKERFKGDIASA